jgi:hypothetical protein
MMTPTIWSKAVGSEPLVVSSFWEARMASETLRTAREALTTPCTPFSARYDGT